MSDEPNSQSTAPPSGDANWPQPADGVDPSSTTSIDVDEAWERANADHLSAAMHWLRLRLQQVADGTTNDSGQISGGPLPPPIHDPAVPDERAAERRGRFGRRRRPAPTAARDVRAATPAAHAPRWSPERDVVTDGEVAAAFERMEATRAGTPQPAMSILAERFDLTRFEEQLLLLCVGLDVDTSLGPLCARAHGDPSRPYPTFALAMSVFEGAAWAAVSPERPLRFWRLVEINQPAAEPLTTSALRADERIVSFVKGLNYLDDRLVPLLVPFDVPQADAAALPPSQMSVADSVSSYLQRTLGGSTPPVVQFVGADELSRQLIARNVAIRAQLNLYRMPAELLPKDSTDVVTLSRLWHRESVLLPIALFLDLDVSERAGGEDAEREMRAAVRRFVDRTAGAFFIGTREVLPQLGASSIAVEVAKPLPIEQREAWRRGAVRVSRADAALLAGQFDLNVATIAAVSSLVPDVGTDQERLDQVWEACLTSTRPRLDLLAQRLEPKAGWDDIVLPEEASELLAGVSAQVRARSRVYDEWGFRKKMNRGLGITALFAGESGTGKTMAAEVLALELGLNLYRIDLSAVVSKYIGETEKNLRRLFDAAEDGGAILFFDEADALFGKRSEVKDSHDRYANIEVNYLLQRMEAFEGLAILATNLRSALDKAFLRRLRFVITFPFPGAVERAEIWRRMFPPETPIADLDYERLGRLNLTGGSIHNVALSASFAAAGSDGVVGMQEVLDAARAEFRKMEKPINEADLRWVTPEVSAPTLVGN